MLNSAEIEFINEHKNANTHSLLLSAKKYQGIDVALCVKCIEARKKIEKKIPDWYNNPALVYPISLSVEQSSSQVTALYKQQLILRTLGKDKFATADLTGGMGIDSYFISQIATQHFYTERNLELCRAAGYNFSQLKANNISIINSSISPDCKEIFSRFKDANVKLIYIDPARRSNTGSKVVSIKDYEPNILELLEPLFDISQYLLIKVSPMEDIKLNLELLPNTEQVHILSLDNECKELLFLLNRDHSQEDEPTITAINLTSSDYSSPTLLLDKEPFNFLISEENSSTATLTSNPKGYIYEPNKALIKSGAYKLISQRYGLSKLASSTHIYASEQLLPNFSGKIFEIEQVIDFNKRALKELAKRIPQASIVARNFPIDTNAIKQLSGIKDGGTKHILAVTLSNGNKVIIVTSPRT